MFFFPFLILGIGTGPQVVLGCMIGMIISGLQLSVSSGISGTVWTVVKK